MKYIILAFFVVPFTIIIGGVIKYNIDLQHYFDQDKLAFTTKDTSIVQVTNVHVVGTVHF